MNTETERVRRIWEKLSPKYDKLMKFQAGHRAHPSG